MKILIDTREQTPYEFLKNAITIERATLPCGDYSLAGFADKIAVERKSIDDLIGCLLGKDRDRFERELARAASFERFAVVVEGALQDIASGRYTSQMKPHAAMQSVMAFFIRYNTPFLFCGNREGAEYVTFSILQKYISELHKRLETLKKSAA